MKCHIYIIVIDIHLTFFEINHFSKTVPLLKYNTIFIIYMIENYFTESTKEFFSENISKFISRA